MTKARPSFHEPDFRKSTRSDPDQNCVHIARRAGWVQMRDTKRRPHRRSKPARATAVAVLDQE